MGLLHPEARPPILVEQGPHPTQHHSISSPKRVTLSLAKSELCKKAYSLRGFAAWISEVLAISWQSSLPFPAWQLQAGNC